MKIRKKQEKWNKIIQDETEAAKVLSESIKEEEEWQQDSELLTESTSSAFLTLPDGEGGAQFHKPRSSDTLVAHRTMLELERQHQESAKMIEKAQSEASKEEEKEIQQRAHSSAKSSQAYDMKQKKLHDFGLEDDKDQADYDRDKGKLQSRLEKIQNEITQLLRQRDKARGKPTQCSQKKGPSPLLPIATVLATSRTVEPISPLGTSPLIPQSAVWAETRTSPLRRGDAKVRATNLSPKSAVTFSSFTSSSSPPNSTTPLMISTTGASFSSAPSTTSTSNSTATSVSLQSLSTTNLNASISTISEQNEETDLQRKKAFPSLSGIKDGLVDLDRLLAGNAPSLTSSVASKPQAASIRSRDAK